MRVLLESKEVRTRACTGKDASVSFFFFFFLFFLLVQMRVRETSGTEGEAKKEIRDIYTYDI